jgi:hypothetical protein
MSPRMTSTEAAPAVPRPRRWRRGLPRVLVESALIVFSVLVALAVDEWRDSRRQRVRAEAALVAILSELEANRAAIERARDASVNRRATRDHAGERHHPDA